MLLINANRRLQVRLEARGGEGDIRWWRGRDGWREQRERGERRGYCSADDGDGPAVGPPAAEEAVKRRNPALPTMLNNVMTDGRAERKSIPLDLDKGARLEKDSRGIDSRWVWKLKNRKENNRKYRVVSRGMWYIRFWKNCGRECGFWNRLHWNGRMRPASARGDK